MRLQNCVLSSATPQRMKIVVTVLYCQNKILYADAITLTKAACFIYWNKNTSFLPEIWLLNM